MLKQIQCTIIKSVLLDRASVLPVNEIRDVKHRHNPRQDGGNSEVRKSVSTFPAAFVNVFRAGGIVDYYA